VNVIRHQVTFFDPALLLLRQRKRTKKADDNLSSEIEALAAGFLKP
jgi:hypothetical protein